MNYWFSIICLLVFSNTVVAVISEENILEITLLKEQGEKSFQQGDFENAIIQWTGLATKYSEGNNKTKHGEALIKLASAHYALAQYSVSIKVLDKASKLIDSSQQKNSVMNRLGATYLAMGNYSKANEFLQSSIDKARINKEDVLLIESLNNLGDLKVKKGEFNLALDLYSESIKIAQVIDNKQLIAKSSVNMAVAAFEIESKDNVGAKLSKAKMYLEETEDDHDKAFGWISLGKIGIKLVKSTLSDKSDWQSFAHYAFKQAERIGRQISDVRAISYAKGNLGTINSDRREYGEALHLTQEAINAIKKLHEPETLYRWQWQKGRILKVKGNNKSVILAYQQAVSTLNSICNSSPSQTSHTRTFHEDLRPLYLELLDLLFQANDSLKEGSEYQQNLLEIWNAVEQLRAAELQDYFKDVCVSDLQKKIKALDKIDPQTAIIYPILFENRVEILLSVSSGLKRFTVPINRNDMINKIQLFRRKLENQTTQEYLPHAQQLYQWLIDPLQTSLSKHKIDTLVMVPDEFFRTIPLAALHDGEKFLIENYAIASAPGLSIADNKAITVDNEKILAMGVSDAVQGFSGLQNVKTELADIKKILGGKVLLNNSFSLKSMKKALQQTPYHYVHFSSHGAFTNKDQENFILTFDSKLNMDRLRQLVGLNKFRKKPVELLVFSASQTTAGDDLATLGMTGIAIKTDARSAVATLWLVNDKAVSLWMKRFYSQLKKGEVTKAQAIKNVQVHLIKKTSYKHPFFWSPFLLVGDWL